MFYYVEQDGKILSYSKDREVVLNSISYLPNITPDDIKETQRAIENFEWADTEEYRYKKIKDEALFEIEKLKNELSCGDYKIIKTMEAAALGDEAPYPNMCEIIKERNAKRARINELEAFFVKI